MNAPEQQRAEWLARPEPGELRRAWQHSCDVIAELDRTAAEFETLRTCD